MKTNTDVMIDLETLGTRPGCVVLSLGAQAFGPDGLGDKFYEVFKIKQMQEAGLEIDAGTLGWWLKQSDKAREVLVEASDCPLQAPSLAYRLMDFEGFLSRQDKEARVWGNGASFDLAIWREVVRRFGRSDPWKYRFERCFRTATGLPHYAGDVRLFERAGVYHNAFDDAKWQARVLMDVLGWKKFYETGVARG